jgi:glycerol transport system substrate-binding protein
MRLRLEEVSQVVSGHTHIYPLDLELSPNQIKWLSDKQAPWKKLANEKPKGETIAYQNLLDAWKSGRVR